MSFSFNPFTDNLDFKNEGGGGGGGITTINGDSGSVTGTAVSLLGQKAGASVSFEDSSATELDLITTDTGLNTLIGQFAGTNVDLSFPGGNVALGYTALFNLTIGTANVGIGYTSMTDIVDGTGNTSVGFGTGPTGLSGNNVAIGANALQNAGKISAAMSNVGVGFNALTSLRNGHQNIAIGENALGSITTASFNTAVGDNALAALFNTGSGNIAIGSDAGVSYGGGENYNIMLGHQGVPGESNVMRLGTQGSGTFQQNTCFIAGITGSTVTGTAVLCATDGQLGTVVSSLRYKDNIKSIDEDVSVLNLSPVQFNYKTDKDKTKQYGLIAEDVDENFPYLCFYNIEGSPESVKYHELPVFLLKEIQRLNDRVIQLEKKTKRMR